MKELKYKTRGMESVSVFTQDAEKLTDNTIITTALSGYAVNGWTRRCIDIIAGQCSAPPWIVVDSNGQAIESHPVAATINNPSPQVTKSQMFAVMVAWLELTGIAPHSFSSAGVGAAMRGRRVISMVSPDRFKAAIAKSGPEIYTGFQVDLNGTGSYAASSDFSLENTVVPRYVDPANPGRGIGTLTSASLAVDQDTSQAKWNIRVFQNKGRVEDVFTFKDNLNKTQTDEITESLYQKMIGGARRIFGKPLVIGANATYQRMGLSAQEMDFINSRKFNREEIFGVFGVPLPLGGSQEASTFNNFSASVRILWEMKIFTVLNNFRDQWNVFFLLNGDLKEGEFLTYDTSRITALRDDEDAKAKTAKEYYTIGVPVSQINDKLKLGFEKYPGWDLPFNGKPIEQQQTESRSSVKYLQLRADDDRDITQESNLVIDSSEEILQPVLQRNLSQSQDDVFALFDKGVFSRSEVLSTIKATQDHDYNKELFDADVKLALRVGETVILRSSYRVQQRAEDDLQASVESMISREANLLTEMSLINATTVDLIMEQVEDFLENNKTLAQLKSAIQDSGIADPIRAQRIARTIGVNAASIGQVASATNAGAQSKEWAVAGANTRDKHSVRNGEVRSMTARFSVQSGSIGPRWPGDADVSADDRINCRCFLIFS